MFERIVDTLAHTIGLTPDQSNKLIGEAIRLVTSQVDGARGLLDRARTLGIIGSASEWLGRADAAPITGEQSRRLFGTSVVEAIAGRLHLPADRAAAALGETIPRLIGQLSPGGTLPAALPAAVLALAPAVTGGPRLSTREAVGSWALRGIILGAIIAALWWLAYNLSKPGDVAKAPSTPPSSDSAAKPAAPPPSGTTTAPAPAAGGPASSAATTAPAATPSAGATAAATVPTLNLSRDESGKVTYSGTVADAGTRAGILAALEAAFGKDNVNGNLNVDSKVGSAPWLTWLSKLFDLFKSSGKGNFAFNLNGPDLKLGSLPQSLDASKLMAGLGGLLGGLSITLPDGSKATPPATTAAAATPAPTTSPAPAATPTAATPTEPQPEPPPTLNLSRDENGKVTVSGTVSNSGTRAALMGALNTAFGKDNVSGTITVDPKVGWAPWPTWFGKMMDLFKSNGGKGNFALNLNGSDVKLGTLPQGFDVSKLMAGLGSLLGGLAITLPDGSKATPATTAAAGSAAGKPASTGPGASLDRNTILAALDSMSPDNLNIDDLTKTLSLMTIEFATNSAEVPSDDRRVLARAAEFFKKLPGTMRIEIQGHTDNSGTAAINDPLSLDRAKAVLDVLVKDGVNKDSFTAKGFGDTRPVASNDTAEGRAQNRRIDYVILSR